MSGEFQLFGFSHIITIIIITLAIVFGLHWLQTYDRRHLQQRLHPWLVALIVLQLFGYRIIFILQNDFKLDYDLPLHLCGLSEMLLIIYLLHPSQKIFDVLYYFILSGAALGPIIPDLHQNFPSVRYFAMFVPHALMVFIMLYLIIVQKMKPSSGSYWKAFKTLNLWAIVVAPINYFWEGNYLYLRQPPAVNFGPVKWLPPWPWYLLVLELFFLLLYRVAYYPFATVKSPVVVSTEK